MPDEGRVRRAVDISTNMTHESPAFAPRHCTVLIVDDNKDIRLLVGRWLSSSGYEVLTAPNAMEALAVVAECRIDVALCDVRLPDRDGTWLAGQIRAASPETQIVFATAVEDLSPFDTLRPGVVGYVVKPLERSDLIELADRAWQAALRTRPRPVGTRNVMPAERALDGPGAVRDAPVRLLPPPPSDTSGTR